MAIDIRAIANCSIGTLISGDIRDDYVQGTGLIKCSGSVELSGVVRPAVGTAVEFSYTRGGTTTYVPRKLRVLSSFADPFRRVTRVELGCKLTYLAQKKPAINWDAFDDPENAGLTEEDAEIITIPIYAASVMNECLSELGISASQNPLTNKFSIETFDFSSGYVEVLSGLLVSESFVGYLDRNEVLQVLPLDQESASGPVIGKAGIIEIRSIGVGDLPGEAVTVSYSSLKLKSPEGTEIDPNNQPVVSSDVNTSSTTSSIIVSYTSPTDGEPRTRVYNILQTTETITKYDQRKKYEEVDGELKETKEKVSVVKERKTTEKITKAAIIGSWISQVLSKGVSVASTQPGLPAVTVTTETYLYNMKCEEIRREMVKMGTESHAVGQVGLPMVFDMSDGSVQVINISDYGLYLLDRNVVETTRSGRNYTKIVTSTYGPWIKTISGQQTIAESRDSFTSKNQVEQYLAQARNGNFLISQTIDTSRAYYSGQAAPSFAEQNNERYADTSGDPSNGYRVESSQDLELAVGSATAQTRIELSLPYAPDDVFIKDGDIYRSTKSDAAIKARNYGRVQNRLLLANRSGMSIQTAAGILPDAPFAAFVVSANGINGVYRTNGMGWTFGPDGVVVSTDALFWGAAGAEPAATGVPWFPVAPGITTLPPSPAVVNGTMTVANVVPVWNETVVIRSRVRIRVTVESLAYALTLPAVVVSKRVRVRGSGRRVVSIELPVTTLTMSGGVPLVHVPAIVNVPVTTLPLSAAVPSVEQVAAMVSLPVTTLALSAPAPEVVNPGVVQLPATTLALSAPVPVVSEGGAVDPNFANVSLLLPMNGTNGSTTFTDSSSNALAVTANGNAQISTGESKFGGASCLLDGSGDYLSVGSSSLFNFGSGALFTVELFIRPTTTSSGGFISQRIGGVYAPFEIVKYGSNRLQWLISNASVSTWQSLGISSNVLTINTWHHIALVGDGTNLKLYCNGTQVLSTSQPSWTSANRPLYIGAGGDNAMTGYIDDLRITKGVARYTANFTPPAAPFPTQGP